MFSDQTRSQRTNTDGHSAGTSEPFHPASGPTLFRAALLPVTLLVALAGCKSTAPVVADDATLARTVQTQLAADNAISGQPILASVQGGAVTLNGTVNNDAQRSIAARDASGVAGIRQVVNNLSIATPPPVSATAATAPLAPLPVPVKRSAAMVEPVRTDRRNPQNDNNRDNGNNRDNNSNRDNNQNNRSNPANQGNNYPNNNGNSNAGNTPAPVAPAQPAFRSVTVTAGSTLPVRVTQTLDSATTQTGDSFSGVVASDVVVDGLVAIPAGSNVSGRVDEVHEAGHFSGNSLLTVSLSTVNGRGNRIPITTEPFSVTGKGRGKNTAEKAGGGAAVGAILGGIFGGGKGAAIGAATGGGLGAGANAITRGQQVQIPSETVVRFRLSNPITVRVRADGARQSTQGNQSNQADPQQPDRTYDNTDPTLQRRPPQ